MPSPAAPSLLLADGDVERLIEPVRMLRSTLDAHGYGRASALPMAARPVDALFDPVNAWYALRGRPNLFHPSGAVRLHEALLARRAPDVLELHRWLFLGQPLPSRRAAELLGADVRESLDDAGILTTTAAGVRSQLIAVPHAGRIFFADPFRLRDDPEYCYVGRSSLTLSEFLAARPDLVPRGGARRMLDLGCGSGIGGLSALPTGMSLLGADIVARCLRFARLNAAVNDIPDTRFVTSDVFGSIDGDFDLIVSNTPCVWEAEAEQGIRTYENGGGTYGLDLPRRMVVESLDHLRTGGTLLAVITAPVIGGGHYAEQLLHEICRERPAEIELHALLHEFEVRNAALYRQHGIRRMVRYLAVVRPAAESSVRTGRFQAGRAASYLVRTVPSRVAARRRSA